MIFCVSCGKEMEAEWNVCPSCGTSKQHSETLINVVNAPPVNVLLVKKNSPLIDTLIGLLIGATFPIITVVMIAWDSYNTAIPFCGGLLFTIGGSVFAFVNEGGARKEIGVGLLAGFFIPLLLMFGLSFVFVALAT